MRIVEYEKDTSSPAYRVTKAIGIAAGIFSLVVCILMIANNTRLNSADPVHSPALEQLIAKLHENPDDEVLREQIRELDYLARAAFFTSQRFTQIGIILLLAGLVVMVACFKLVGKFNETVPYPDSDDPKDDIVEEAKWARWAVGAAGLLLAGFALSLAIPWTSPLNDFEGTSSLPGAGTGDDPATAAAGGTPEEAPAAPLPEVAPVSEEELLKNWPSFRGAGHGVVAHSGEFPTAWNGETGEGIAWKTAIPKPGFSSPIIWNDRIFLTGGDEEGLEVYCIDAGEGAILWQKEVTGIPGSPEELPEVQADTGHAASTMATNGTLVFATFCNGDLVAFDFDGNQVWARALGMPENNYGHASSLVVYEDLLLVQFDHDGEGASRFLGLDVRNGENRWEVKREFPASWSTPLVINTGERMEVILLSDPMVVSYDPKTGEELWRVECLEAAETGATPVYADGLLYVGADYVNMLAINVATKEIVWEDDYDIAGVCTPVVADGHLYYGLAEGGLVRRDAKSGELTWNELTDDGFYSSPVVVGEHVYIMERSGKMHIIAPAAEYKLVADPALGEEAVASPAIVGDSIFIRGVEHLYRIGS